MSSSFLIELADYFHASLDYLILGRGGRTGEVKEELTEIKAVGTHHATALNAGRKSIVRKNPEESSGGSSGFEYI